VNSLKALDPEWPIREADIGRQVVSAKPVAIDPTPDSDGLGYPAAG
jgi:hypothetical protein